MFNRIKNFTKSHWQKVVIGGVAVQVLVYGVKYVAGRFMEYHEVKALDLWKKMKKEQHFESTESTFKSSFLALVVNLKETVTHSLDAETLAGILKTGNLEIGTKLEIWERLKIIGFSRIVVIIYGSSLLNVLLRIQLSIIGGYLFIESNDSDPKHEWRNVNGIILSNNTAMDMDLQQKYLSLATYLVKFGVMNLSEYIYRKTIAIVGSIGLKEKITISDLEQLLLSIVAAVNQDIVNDELLTDGCNSPTKYPWKYIFPTDILETHNYFGNTVQKCRPHYEPPDMYERLLADTFDLLDSDDVTSLLNSFERQGISHFCDRIADYVVAFEKSIPNGTVDPLANTENLITQQSTASHFHIFSEVQVPMAKIIPMLNDLVAQGINESDPWISVLCNSETARNFAANVYESFSNSID